MCQEKPDLELAGFSLRVLGRQFPDLDDYWDGNWLDVLARMEDSGAIVEVQGPILHVPELAAFVEELEALNRTLTGKASLRCMEPNLDITINTEARGSAVAKVAITPDQMTQSHSFTILIDQSYFLPLLIQCRKLLARWPVKGDARDGT